MCCVFSGWGRRRQERRRSGRRRRQRGRPSEADDGPQRRAPRQRRLSHRPQPKRPASIEHVVVVAVDAVAQAQGRFLWWQAGNSGQQTHDPQRAAERQASYSWCCLSARVPSARRDAAHRIPSVPEWGPATRTCSWIPSQATHGECSVLNKLERYLP